MGIGIGRSLACHVDVYTQTLHGTAIYMPTLGWFIYADQAWGGCIGSPMAVPNGSCLGYRDATPEAAWHYALNLLRRCKLGAKNGVAVQIDRSRMLLKHVETIRELPSPIDRANTNGAQLLWFAGSSGGTLFENGSESQLDAELSWNPAQLLLVLTHKCPGDMDQSTKVNQPDSGKGQL